MHTNLNPKDFLKKYWQKKPLLIRQAYPNYKNPLSVAKMLQLATEDTAESRIILEKGGKRPWELQHGPFKKAIFKKLPATHWTLLVQGTNHWVPALQSLLEDFYFIPQWRIEDIMTSFAVRGGNVGAHLDNYDVFLLQAEGQREWRISNKPILEDDFLPEHEVKLLRKFKSDQKFILNPGDMLYLPPRIAHHGIALTDDCITHSIGFRAPALAEMLDDYLTYLLSTMDAQQRYSDPDLKLQKNSAEISTQALNKIIQSIRKTVNDEQQIKRWFGQYITQNKYTNFVENIEAISSTDLRKKIRAGELLIKNPRSRFAYIIDGQQLYFYVNGEEYCLPKKMLDFVKLLTAENKTLQKVLPQIFKDKSSVNLLVNLVNAGHFYFDG